MAKTKKTPQQVPYDAGTDDTSADLPRRSGRLTRPTAGIEPHRQEVAKAKARQKKKPVSAGITVIAIYCINASVQRTRNRAKVATAVAVTVLSHLMGRPLVVRQ